MTLNQTPTAAGTKSSGQSRRRRSAATSASAAEPAAMPQWMFDLIVRPLFGTLSRAAWKIRLHGVENIPHTRDGGCLIAANHQTYIDPFWISIPVKRPIRYLAWDEAFDWKLTGKFMHWFGAYPLQLEGGDRRAMQRSLKWLKSGGALMIFPEGGRGNADGTMHRFKTGAARLALEARVPVLPVTLSGAHKVWNSTQKLPRLAPVTITYHPLYQPAINSGEDERTAARRITDDLMHIIASKL